MFSEQQLIRLVDLSNLALNFGMVMQARKICEGIEAIKPNFEPALISLAFSYIVVDDFSVAQEILDKILQSDPDNEDALGMLAVSHILSGNIILAEEEISRLSEDSPAGTMARSFMRASK